MSNRVLIILLLLGCWTSSMSQFNAECTDCLQLVEDSFQSWDLLEESNPPGIMTVLMHSTHYRDGMQIDDTVKVLTSKLITHVESETVTIYLDEVSAYMCLHEEREIVEVDLELETKSGTKSFDDYSPSKMRSWVLDQFVFRSHELQLLDTLGYLGLEMRPKSSSHYYRQVKDLTLLFDQDSREFKGYRIQYTDQFELVAETRIWLNISPLTSAPKEKRASDFLFRNGQLLPPFKDYTLIQ